MLIKPSIHLNSENDNLNIKDYIETKPIKENEKNKQKQVEIVNNILYFNDLFVCPLGFMLSLKFHNSSSERNC